MSEFPCVVCSEGVPDVCFACASDFGGFERGCVVGAAIVAWGLAIAGTHDPWRTCACGASYSGPEAHPTLCFGCADELTPEWQAWAKEVGMLPRLPGKRPL